MHIRTYHFVLPFHQIRPSRRSGLPAGGRSHLGADGRRDHHGLQLALQPDRRAADDEDRHEIERRLGNGPHDVDQTTFRSIRNRQNNYLLDRKVQKTESFTGIDGINTQDRAIQESMGAVVDRSREHLGPADRAVIQARRLLLEAVRTTADGGTPRGVAPTYYSLSAAEAVLPRTADWREIPAHDAARLSAAPR